ncbi:MAG: YceD family protein [Gammaproteobacteria bacterium]|nr:MAG: YceD family protein [Gammaproteobacteria bacterium]
MSGRIPAHIDPFRFADLGNRLSGTIPITELSRLCQVCNKADSTLALDMSFSKGDSGPAIMQGNISGNLVLVCQRCLEPMRHGIDLESRFYFSRPGLRHNGIDDVDVIVVEGELDLYALIEDEVLLSLPMIAMHVAEECPVAALMAEKDETKLQKQNPFAVLKNIKQ